MKRIIVEDTESGLESLLGERVLLLCANYFYEGVLEGVNETCVLLDDAKLVYETGSWTDKGYTDAQSLPSKWYIATAFIESFGRSK